MKILFDQGVPAPLRFELADHTVFTASEMGWDTLSNGDLLRGGDRATRRKAEGGAQKKKK